MRRLLLASGTRLLTLRRGGGYHQGVSTWNYIAASLKQYWRIHASVAAGVAIASAVITGALLVGASMRGSLRDLALSRLGRIDSMLIAQHPFDERLVANSLEKSAGEGSQLSAEYTQSAPLYITRGAASLRAGGSVHQAAKLAVYGVAESFWSLDGNAMGEGALDLGEDEVLLTPNVAIELGAKHGERILLRVPKSGSLPGDSVLGEKDGAYASRRFRVRIADVQAMPLAGFSMQRSQRSARNVFLSLAALQDLLEFPGKVNAVALAGDAVDTAKPQAAREILAMHLKPTLADLGINVQELENHSERVVQIAADRLVLPPSAVDAVNAEFPEQEVQRAITYLANSLRKGGMSVPYSTITGIQSTADLGPLLDDAGQAILLADDEIVLNEWAAERLDAHVDDKVTLEFYEPETAHGELEEHQPLNLTLKAIIPLEDPAGKPTAAADPLLTPELPGVTDQDSINDWDLPFELVEKIENEDENYWKEHRTTPKAFVSHSLAAKLWATRWGTESVLRVVLPEDISVQEFSDRLADGIDPSTLGMSVVGIKEQALQAASGTTPFDGLFLGFSCFIMASAVLLIALLFRLGAQQRAKELGLLSAVGLPSRRIARALVGEGAIVAAIGAACGMMAGVTYAQLMIYGLNTWWVAATVTPFLELHVPAWALLTGWLIGLLVSLVTIWWTILASLKQSPTALLAGQAEQTVDVKSGANVGPSYGVWACVLVAIAAAMFAWLNEGEAQAGAFFAGGSAVLTGLLLLVRRFLRAPISISESLSLTRLSFLNTRRNPGRTLLTIALAAAASFLIVALAAFRLAPTTAGTGGYDIWATTDLPLYHDLETETGRAALGFSKPDDISLSEMTVAGFRVSEGEDASCLNLFQAASPRILGVPEKLSVESDFTWGSKNEQPTGESPWDLLHKDLGTDSAGLPIVPMILDRNTAYYGLKLYAVGAQRETTDSANRPRTLQVVAMLTNSIFQGDLLISNQQFLQLFPETSGQRLFLIRSGRTESDLGRTTELATQLESQLVDYGFDTVDAQQRLAEFLAVQNTYLSTFQSLGALGLLLGAAGLAVAQLRSVAERRGELALMRAAGLRKTKLAKMVFTENLALLIVGLEIGCLAALAVVVPLSFTQEAGIPWGALVITLGSMIAVGAVAGWFATRTALRAPLLPALRGD
uniref:ABC transporter permease n=1 Tax=Adhaeretor mobilis TaxID=1930276 RepID=UPI0011A78AE4|nr:ABC transporter permease [Adhaeretor mobilis]